MPFIPSISSIPSIPRSALNSRPFRLGIVGRIVDNGVPVEARLNARPMPASRVEFLPEWGGAPDVNRTLAALGIGLPL